MLLAALFAFAAGIHPAYGAGAVSSCDEASLVAALSGGGIVPEQGQWRVYFLGFARSGWTSGAMAYQDQVNQQPVSGANWVTGGVRLVTLEQVDNDLAAWSA